MAGTHGKIKRVRHSVRTCETNFQSRIQSSMSKYTYKYDSFEDYMVRFCQDEYPIGYAKLRGGSEVKTDFLKNNTGYEVYRTGQEVTKEEYESF